LGTVGVNPEVSLAFYSAGVIRLLVIHRAEAQCVVVFVAQTWFSAAY